MEAVFAQDLLFTSIRNIMPLELQQFDDFVRKVGSMLERLQQLKQDFKIGKSSLIKTHTRDIYMYIYIYIYIYIHIYLYMPSIISFGRSLREGPYYTEEPMETFWVPPPIPV